MSKFGTVKVMGASMAPTLRDGDWLFIHWFKPSPAHTDQDNFGERFKLIGKVVVIEREERPGIFLVKRLQKSQGGSFWVQGDNQEGIDSRTWGWIPASEVVGIVLFKYRKGRFKKSPKH